MFGLTALLAAAGLVYRGGEVRRLRGQLAAERREHQETQRLLATETEVADDALTRLLTLRRGVDGCEQRN